MATPLRCSELRPSKCKEQPEVTQLELSVGTCGHQELVLLRTGDLDGDLQAIWAFTVPAPSSSLPWSWPQCVPVLQSP